MSKLIMSDIVDKQAEAEQLWAKSLKFVKRYIDATMLDYLQKFESETYRRIQYPLLSESKSCKDYKDKLHNWMRDCKRVYNRLSKSSNNKQKAELHILKSDLQLSEAEYKSYIEEVTGVRSAKYMNYFQIKLAISRLKKLKNASLS